MSTRNHTPYPRLRHHLPHNATRLHHVASQASVRGSAHAATRGGAHMTTATAFRGGARMTTRGPLAGHSRGHSQGALAGAFARVLTRPLARLFVHWNTSRRLECAIGQSSERFRRTDWCLERVLLPVRLLQQLTREWHRSLDSEWYVRVSDEDKEKRCQK